MSVGERLREARRHAKLTQVELYERSGVPQQTIGNLETGATKTSRNIIALARACGVRAEWLATGEGPMLETEPGPNIYARVPLISWVQAGAWRPRICGRLPGAGDDFIPTTKRIGPRAFALRVRGDSMVNPHGRPSYPEGCIIVVDPDRAAQPGARVIARLPDQDEATFKQLVSDAGRLYLKPLNPLYPLLPVDQRTQIVGVVVQTIVDEETG